MKFQNKKSISEIREEERVLAEKDARIAQLEADLAAAKEENLMIMEAMAEVYEENLKLKSDNLMTMEAVAEVYEMVLALQNGGTA